MNIRESLLNKWIEFSGGSRPGSRMIRFEEIKDSAVMLQIRYVYDWNTMETITMSFDLSHKEFDQLVNTLIEKGYAAFNRDTNKERLSFEWRLSEGVITFRLACHQKVDYYGGQGFQMTEYSQLLLNHTF